MAAAYLSGDPVAKRLRWVFAALLVALRWVFAVLLSALLFAPGAGAATTFFIRGAGNGHGIGMSQYGAYGYALQGKSDRWILGHYYQGTSLGRLSATPTVRVLVRTGSAVFSGATRVGSKRVKPGISYAVRPNADGTLAVLKPSGKKLGTFDAPLSASGPGPLSLAGAGSYRGALQFRPGPAGIVETVNVVGLEDYVRGVISAEMPSSWAPAALEAQAVAARTYAITSDAGGSVFDLYADIRSQMYGGVGAETAATDAAVAATHGQVVTYRGAPVATYFSASSGGHTENVENVWPGATPEPWLRGVIDRYDGAGGRNPYSRWGFALTPARAAAKLGGWLRGGLVGIRVTKHGVSPRIVSALVVGTKGSSPVTGAQLQQAFGLPSTDARFETITVLAGRAAGPATGRASGSGARGPGSGAGRARGSATRGLSSRVGLAAAKAMLALVPLVRRLVASAPGLHGTVFPGAAGSVIAVQRRTRAAGRTVAWRTVVRVRVRPGGSFDTALPRTGVYRIVYRGLHGPAVTVSAG